MVVVKSYMEVSNETSDILVFWLAVVVMATITICDRVVMWAMSSVPCSEEYKAIGRDIVLPW